MHLPLNTRTVLRTDSQTIDAVSIKDGAIFAVLSTDAVTLWHADTLTQLHCTRRVTASLESTGFNRRIFLRSDDQVVVVQTAGNVLLIYDLCEDAEADARSLKTASHEGVPRLWLKHRQNIRVEAGVLGLCATAECLTISTKRPAMVQALYWNKHVGEMQTISRTLKALSFVKRSGSATRIVDIIYHAPQDCYLWLTSDGNVYLVESGHEQWTGIPVHESHAQGHEAVLLTSNGPQGVLTVSLANSDLLTWAIFREDGNIHTRQIYRYRCENEVGSIRSLQYTPDGDSLLVCGETGWALLTTYGCLIHSTSWVASGPAESISTETNESRSASLLRCSIWIRNAYAAVFCPLDEDALVVADFCTASGMTLRCPRLLYVNQQSNTSSESDVASNTWSAILPTSEVAHLSPFRTHSDSPCGRFLAIAGQFGLAHYSHASELWKTHRTLDEARETILVAQPVWYHHYLVVATHLDDSQFMISILSREFELSESLSSIVIDHEPLILSVQNGHLYFILADQTIHKWQIMRNKEGQILMNKIASLPMPARFSTQSPSIQSLDVLHENTDTDFAHLVLLHGDRLFFMHFSTGDKQQLKVVIMADQIDRAQVIDGTGRLRNAVMASSGRNLKIWFNVLNHTEMTEDMPAASLKIALDFIPVHVSVAAGLIEGILVKDMNKSDMATSNLQNLSYEARSFVPEVLQNLIRNDLIGEAFVISTRYASCSQFTYYLELLLYRALEESSTGDDAILRATWGLLEKHSDLMPQVVVACARKSEISTWSILFEVTGPPVAFYRKSLASGDLKTAGAYLVILLTLDTTLNHKDYTMDLITQSIQQGYWDLAIELTRFYSVVTGDKQQAFVEISGLLR